MDKSTNTVLANLGGVAGPVKTKAEVLADVFAAADQ